MTEPVIISYDQILQEGFPSAVYLGSDTDSETATVTGTKATGQQSSFSKAPRAASKWPIVSALETRCG